MNLDAPTLFIWSMVSEMSFAALLLLLWKARRNEPALVWWSASSFCGALACLAIGLRGHVPDQISVAMGNAILVGAWSLRFGGLLHFDRKTPRLLELLTPPIAVGIAFLFHEKWQLDFEDRVLVVSIVICGILTRCGWHCWHAQRREFLTMRRVALTFFLLNALYHLFRALMASGGAIATDSLLVPDQVYGILLITMLAISLGMQVGSLMMVFERQENRLQRAAAIDGLTEVLNRSAFLPLADRLRERDMRDKKPSSFLLMDLDNFKAINGTARVS